MTKNTIKLNAIVSAISTFMSVTALAGAPFSTSFESEGPAKESFMLENLVVSCPESNVLNGFRLNRERNEDVPTGRMRYDFECSQVEQSKPSPRRFTGWSDEFGGNTVFLDRLNIACQPDEAMSQFTLQRQRKNGMPTGQFGYFFTCTQINVLKITQHETAFNDDGRGENIYLDRHNVSCPGDTVLNAFTLVRNPDLNQYKYIYNCAEVAPKGSAALMTVPAERPLPPTPAMPVEERDNRAAPSKVNNGYTSSVIPSASNDYHTGPSQSYFDQISLLSSSVYLIGSLPHSAQQALGLTQSEAQDILERAKVIHFLSESERTQLMHDLQRAYEGLLKLKNLNLNLNRNHNYN